SHSCLQIGTFRAGWTPTIATTTSASLASRRKGLKSGALRMRISSKRMVRTPHFLPWCMRCSSFTILSHLVPEVDYHVTLDKCQSIAEAIVFVPLHYSLTNSLHLLAGWQEGSSPIAQPSE